MTFHIYHSPNFRGGSYIVHYIIQGNQYLSLSYICIDCISRTKYNHILCYQYDIIIDIYRFCNGTKNIEITKCLEHFQS